MRGAEDPVPSYCDGEPDDDEDYCILDPALEMANPTTNVTVEETADDDDASDTIEAINALDNLDTDFNSTNAGNTTTNVTLEEEPSGEDAVSIDAIELINALGGDTAPGFEDNTDISVNKRLRPQTKQP